MSVDEGLFLAQVEGDKQRERAERILNAAAELLLRHGYNRITVDDIARQAAVGKGTVYLHWKTKKALFRTLLLREALSMWRERLNRVREDPGEVQFSRMMRSLLLAISERPLARALFTGDVELLGKLAANGMDTAGQSQHSLASRDFLRFMRDEGLLRTDMALAAQSYAIAATVMGFYLVDPSLREEARLPLAEKADVLAQTVRNAFEPADMPPPGALPAIAARAIRWFEEALDAYERQVWAQMGTS